MDAQGTGDELDPRVVRTRRDVVDAATEIHLAEGWAAVTHAEVARRSGYAKATIYTHWPTRLDLIRASVGQICGAAGHPEPTGDLRADLIAGLSDFAEDLSQGHLARVIGGILERADSDPAVDELRRQVNAEGTRSLESVLRAHLAPGAVEPSLALLTGAVFTRTAIQALPADAAFVADVVDRVLLAAERTDDG
ncbi:TetR/AcrR family transcriptional regulator [Streptomyces otsuchiensis]|uniref:TetR/AcrR family transcriptional regulator n=1 Tax=Streptomyces otsuchiensis TaxID=2681388 RepID=UPI00103274F8|nr:TetR/AcrR family transcriptional regulator [Streptomyces otsuchiensis]